MAGRPAIRDLISLPAFMLLLAGTAQAAGSSMPWEGRCNPSWNPSGAGGAIVAVIIIATGLALAFGDTSGGFRKLIQIVFGLSSRSPLRASSCRSSASPVGAVDERPDG